jgi:DNA ligase (NAD+)
MGRKEAQAMVIAAGGVVKDSVGAGLTYLVTNDPNSGSSKNEKAVKYGTKLITEEQFVKLIGEI